MTTDLDALIADSREWVQLHRENKYQREAAKRMAGVLDALEAEHKRAERLDADHTDSEKALIDSVLALTAERDELRANLNKVRQLVNDGAPHWVLRRHLPLSRIPEHDDTKGHDR